MEVWKIIFLSKVGDLKVPAVNLSGCIPYMDGIGWPGWSRKHPTIFFVSLKEGGSW